MHDRSRCLVFILCPILKKRRKISGLGAKDMDMYCSTEQKVKSLSKHMLCISSRPIISKSLAASLVWAAITLLCWERIGARQEQRWSSDKALLAKMHIEATRERKMEDTLIEVSHSRITPMRWQFIITQRAVLLCQPSESYETCFLFDVQ